MAIEVATFVLGCLAFMACGIALLTNYRGFRDQQVARVVRPGKSDGHRRLFNFIGVGFVALPLYVLVLLVVDAVRGVI